MRLTESLICEDSSFARTNINEAYNTNIEVFSGLYFLLLCVFFENQPKK